jgi:hypothetical protein
MNPAPPNTTALRPVGTVVLRSIFDVALARG